MYKKMDRLSSGQKIARGEDISLQSGLSIGSE